MIVLSYQVLAVLVKVSQTKAKGRNPTKAIKNTERHNDAVIIASFAPEGYSFSSSSLSSASASSKGVSSMTFFSPALTEGLRDVVLRMSFSKSEGLELGATVLSLSGLAVFGFKKGTFILADEVKKGWYAN